MPAGGAGRFANAAGDFNSIGAADLGPAERSSAAAAKFASKARTEKLTALARDSLVGFYELEGKGTISGGTP